MKKVLILLVSIVMMLAITVPAFAAGTASVTCAAPSEAKLGETVTVTVSLSNCDPFKSIGLTPVYDKNVFELVSGAWVNADDAALANFNGTSGVAAFGEPVTKSGAIFAIELKVKDDVACIGNTTVSVTPVIKNSTEVIEAAASAATIKVICAEHTFADWTVTTEATCTEAGAKERICTVCKTKETGVVDAAGHSFGNWVTFKEATCSAYGQQKRTCSACEEIEYNSFAKTSHVFGDPVVVKEATETETGLKEAKCKYCDATTQEEIPCIEAVVEDTEPDETEPATEPVTEPATEPATEPSTEVTVPETQPTEPKGNDQAGNGIGDMMPWIILALMILLIIIVIIIIIVKKKKQEY